jgi:hypothetical protein
MCLPLVPLVVCDDARGPAHPFVPTQGCGKDPPRQARLKKYRSRVIILWIVSGKTTSCSKWAEAATQSPSYFRL